MDKYTRRDNGYKSDYPDGVYEVVHINDMELPIKEKHKRSRIIEIKNGFVLCPKLKFLKDGKVVESGEITKMAQDYFFEVNEVIDAMPSF